MRIITAWLSQLLLFPHRHAALQKLLREKPNSTVQLKFVADAPTVTMQRLKQPRILDALARLRSLANLYSRTAGLRDCSSGASHRRAAHVRRRGQQLRSGEDPRGQPNWPIGGQQAAGAVRRGRHLDGAVREGELHFRLAGVPVPQREGPAHRGPRGGEAHAGSHAGPREGPPSPPPSPPTLHVAYRVLSIYLEQISRNSKLKCATEGVIGGVIQS
eukprot:1094088-Prorocentrum_minimum.AAC.2